MPLNLWNAILCLHTLTMKVRKVEKAMFKLNMHSIQCVELLSQLHMGLVLGMKIPFVFLEVSTKSIY